MLVLIWWLGRPPDGAPHPVALRQHPALEQRGSPSWPRASEPSAFRVVPPPQQPPPDPLLAAIPADARHVAIFQVNALAHAPLGRLVLDCQQEEGRDLLARLERAGLDPRVDVDRLVTFPGAVVATGFFRRTDPLALAQSLPFSSKNVAVRPYGPETTLVAVEMCPIFECSWMEVAKRGDATIAIGEPEQVRSLLDRLQGRSTEAPLALPDDALAADIFAVTSLEEVARSLGLDDPVLKQWLSALPARAELRVDAMRDVRATVRVTPEDPAAASDFAELLEATRAAAAAKARAAGDAARFEVLERLVIVQGWGELTLSLDLPLDVIERQFPRCRERADAAPPRPAVRPVR